jgi:hypothetical protein
MILLMPFLLLMCFSLPAQLVPVAEMTIKIAPGEDKDLYYSFAAGDELLFSFIETGGKKIKEVSISAWPDQVRYAAYEITDTRDQRISVPATAVYHIRFSNRGSISERICNVSIRRKPENKQTLAFNTAVRWEERLDTFYRDLPAWTDVAEVQKRYVTASVDTGVIQLLERTERINSRSGILYGSPSAEIRFSIPASGFQPSAARPQSSTEIISWAYWLGVGDDADRNYRDANLKAAGKLAEAASGLQMLAGAATGYGALALLAVKGVGMFSNPPKGDNVLYTLKTEKGQELDKGNSIVAFRRMEKPLQGDVLLLLENDNMVDGINVAVKIIAVTLNKTYREEPYIVFKRVPLPPEQRQGTPTIKKIRIPYVASA